MRRIAVINQKGGTGKTTTVGNLGAGLALVERKILLIDFDPQGALSTWFDITHERNLIDLMKGESELKDCTYKVRENLYLLPCDRRLSEFREWVEEEWWGKIESGEGDGLDQYDYVLMDCPPSWSQMSRIAVKIAGEVFMPVSMDYLSIIGVRQVVEWVGEIVDEEGDAPEIAMVIPTFYDSRQKKSREILEVLQLHFGRSVSEPVRSNVRLSEAISYHQSIFEYAPESYGAKDYERLVRRVEYAQEEQSNGGRSPREDSGSPEGPGEQKEIFERSE